ncbi:MAG: hypothetical protein U5K81_02865 [Trueperaceae bacterium]|nr:hypothetical protein [Trueperaceae bacterium]
MRTATDVYDGLDVLVNNAGVMDAFQGVASVDDDTWQCVRPCLRRS